MAQAFRYLRRHPRLALTTVAILALGLGLDAAVFSVTNAVVLRPLPFPDPSRLVAVVSQSSDGTESAFLAEPAAEAVEADRDDFQSVGRSWPVTIAMAAGEVPEQLSGLYVSAGWFDTYGVPPAIGRRFVDADALGASDAVVISHRLWIRDFAGDPAVVGRPVELSVQPTWMLTPSAPALSRHYVVGVMPSSGSFPVDGDVWLPLPPIGASNMMGGPPPAILQVVGRLKPEAWIGRANARLAAITPPMRPGTSTGSQAKSRISVRALLDVTNGDYRGTVLALFAVVTLLLVLTCVSVGAIVVSRNLTRRREVEIRLALGASKGVLARQFLAEGLSIGIIGAIVGAAVARLAVELTVRLAPAGIPRLESVRVDGAVLAYLACVAIVSGVVIGVWPARSLRPHRAAPVGRLARRVLVAAQLALVVPLVVGTVIAARGLGHLLYAPLGFVPDRVLTFAMRPTSASCHDLASCDASIADLLARAQQMPGLEASAMSGTVPLGITLCDTITPPGSSTPMPVCLRPVSPDYFRVLRMPIRAGRPFDDRDSRNAPRVVIVSASLARQAFGGSAVGKILTSGVFTRQRSVEVVGVVDDTRDGTTDAATRAVVYLPLDQADVVFHPTLLVRTSVPTATVVAAVRAAVGAIDAHAPIYDVASLETRLLDRAANPLFQTALITVFGVLGLIVAVAGTTALIASVMTHRQRELAVRTALGATSHDLLRMVAVEGASAVGAGVAVGLTLAAAGVRVTNALFFSAGPLDVTAVVAAAGGMLVIGLAAYVWPARSRSRIDPMLALRQE